MHIFMFVCFITLASAQYKYGADVSHDDDTLLDVSSTDDSVVSNTKPLEEEYNKVFYSYSAPEHEFDDLNAEEHITKALKRNLRVIFIKGPENTALENAALQLAKSAADDQTAIYVLSKQSDIASLANQLQKHKSKNAAKPEVHFVKYRTQADAESAQRAIQAQYDSLPGTSNNNGHSTAPVANFASKSISSSAINSLAVGTAATTTHAPSRNIIASRNNYLPPNKRY